MFGVFADFSLTIYRFEYKISLSVWDQTAWRCHVVWQQSSVASGHIVSSGRDSSGFQRRPGSVRRGPVNTRPNKANFSRLTADGMCVWRAGACLRQKFIVTLWRRAIVADADGWVGWKGVLHCLQAKNKLVVNWYWWKIEEWCKQTQIFKKVLNFSD